MFDRVHSWPWERQDDAVAVLLALEAEGDEGACEPSPEERAELEEPVAEIERGEVAAEHEVAAAFRRRT